MKTKISEKERIALIEYFKGLKENNLKKLKNINRFKNFLFWSFILLLVIANMNGFVGDWIGFIIVIMLGLYFIPKILNDNLVYKK